MKKITAFIFLIALLYATPKAMAYSDAYYKSIAEFVHSLPKMIEGGGGLCVYGYDQVTVEIKEKYKDTTFFKVEDNLKEGIAQSHCKVLYISNNKGSVVYPAIRIANEAKVISIGIDDNDFIDKGGTMVVQIGRRSFELMINHKTIKELKVKLDPLVEGLIIN